MSTAGALLALAVPASSAVAAPSRVTGLSWSIALDRRLEMHLNANCTVPNGLAWPYTGPPRAKQNYFGTPPGFDTAAGWFDPAARKGSAAGHGVSPVIVALDPRAPFEL